MTNFPTGRLGGVVLLVVSSAATMVMAQEPPPAPSAPAAVTCEETDPKSSATTIDTRGVEFGPWVRRFVNVVRKSWLVEESKVNGCVILAFNVHRDGTIDEIVIRHPSSTSAYNENARQALVRAGRVEPLPADYDREFAAITVTFFYRMGATPAVAPLKP